MAKKPAKPRTAKATVVTNDKDLFTTHVGVPVKNGLGDAIGYPGNQGTGWSSQVSQVTTGFVNLRWYLVSNMRQFLNELFVEVGLVRTICEVPVQDAFRGGVDIKSKELDEDEIQKLQMSMDQNDDININMQANIWNRLFGGAGILIITEQDPETELDLNAINEDSELEFRAVDMWELFWDQQNVEGFNAAIEDEQFEFYSYYGTKVHKSRVLPLKGITAPSFVRPRLRGWGFSVVESLISPLNQYLKNIDVSFEVLDEFKLDVFKIKNLTSTLMSPQGEQAVRQRIQMANWQKNYQNAITMDSEDDFDHKQLSFAGLAEVMAGIRMQIASAMRMPLTKIFGISAAGFNSGEDDIEVYNAMIESEVRGKAKFHLLRQIQIRCQQLFGYIPDDLDIEFKPLRMLSAEQEENVKTQKFTRLLQAKQAGELTTHEFREGCNKDNLLSITLDTTGDDLNPDDPEIEDVLEGNLEDAALAEGANKPDTKQMPVKKSKTQAKPAKEAKE